MFKQTHENYLQVFEVYEKYKDSTPLKDRWKKRAQELNELFNTQLTSIEWKSQYDSAMLRFKKRGDASVIQPKVKKQKEAAPKRLNMKDLLEIKMQLLDYISKPRTIDAICKKLDIDTITANGLIQILISENYNIINNAYEKTYLLSKKVVEEVKEYIHGIGDVQEFEFAVMSCSHWCAKGQQKGFINFVYDEAKRRGIKDVYHVGDIVDGYYKNRPEHIFELFAIGADEQKDYVVNNWPKIDGITTHLILGNHDETHIKNGGYNIGRAIAQEREDFKYLGIGHAKVWLTEKCRMDLFHPLDGSSYAISYSGQKYMDSLTGGDKPNILFTGHHHKSLYFVYRNIHYFEVPSTTSQSSWMKRKRIANDTGVWFVKVKVDSEGTVISVLPEMIHQYKFLNHDY